MWNCSEESNWYYGHAVNGFRECDPVEVRALKSQLAQLSCKQRNYKLFETLESAPDLCDHGVQVKSEPRKCDQNTQITSDMEKSSHLFNPFPHNSNMCPTCLYTFGFLKSRMTKVMKDEELETDLKIGNSDKSAENVQDCVSGTTSFTSPPYSSVAFHDYSSECLSDGAYRHRSPKRSNHEVTFLDDFFGQSLPEHGILRSPQCFCVDNFMEEIRPPMK